jgi:hypothetical protein
VKKYSGEMIKGEGKRGKESKGEVRIVLLKKGDAL